MNRRGFLTALVAAPVVIGVAPAIVRFSSLMRPRAIGMVWMDGGAADGDLTGMSIMARLPPVTNFAQLSAEQVAVWRHELWRHAFDMAYINHFAGTPGELVGDTIRIRLVDNSRYA